METYRAVCPGCSNDFEFERSARPGAYIGIQCPKCSGIFSGRTPGKAGRTDRTRTKDLQGAILKVFAENKPPLTVRQMFYALEVRGLVPKTDKGPGNGYRQAQYQLAVMRRAGVIPYGWIADNTRWQIKDAAYSGLDQALEHCQQTYRRDLWASQAIYCEVWVEKDALAGVIAQVTRQYDVPLCVARGFASMSFTYEMAEQLKAIGKPAYIYHFGDFDPSGKCAADKIGAKLAEHGARVYFERAAITEDQIAEYSLPTRPTKSTDPRAAKWGNKPSVELDALPAPALRALVRTCIERHVDPEELERLRAIEAEERATLGTVLSNLVRVQNSTPAPALKVGEN